MERATVRAQAPGVRHVGFADGTDPAAATAAALSAAVPSHAIVGAEVRGMFLPPALLDGLRAALPGVTWVDCTGLLASLRAVKSPAELAIVRQAAGVSDAAMRAAIATAGVGARERDVAAAALHAMVTAGGAPPGFVPLVRSTAVLDQEHVTWSDRALGPGEGLLVELAGCVGRYHAPLARTVYIGHTPAGAEDAAGAARAGLTAALHALRPGVRTGDVFAAWQRAVATSSSGSWPRRHHCGYLVGIGFAPSWVGGGEVLGIRPDGEVEVAAGMVFHLMSWVEQPTGHVVSDTVLVTTQGAEVLTGVPRELTVVGP
jgi:Xaa-Pro dipeptidase